MSSAADLADAIVLREALLHPRSWAGVDMNAARDVLRRAIKRAEPVIPGAGRRAPIDLMPVVHAWTGGGAPLGAVARCLGSVSRALRAKHFEVLALPLAVARRDGHGATRLPPPPQPARVLGTRAHDGGINARVKALLAFAR